VASGLRRRAASPVTQLGAYACKLLSRWSWSRRLCEAAAFPLAWTDSAVREPGRSLPWGSFLSLAGAPAANQIRSLKRGANARHARSPAPAPGAAHRTAATP